MQPHPTSFLSSSFIILPKVFQVFVKFPLLCCPARPCQVAWPCHLGIAVQSFPPCLPLEHVSPVLRGLYPAYLSFWILYLLVFASPSPLFLELILVIWSAPTVCFYNKHSPDHPRAENETGAKSRNPQVLWTSQCHAYSSSFSWGNQGSDPSGDSSRYSTVSWSDPQPHSQAEDTRFTAIGVQAPMVWGSGPAPTGPFPCWICPGDEKLSLLSQEGHPDGKPSL